VTGGEDTGRNSRVNDEIHGARGKFSRVWTHLGATSDCGGQTEQLKTPCRGVQPLRRFPPCSGDQRRWLLPLVVGCAVRAATTFGTPTARTMRAQTKSSPRFAADFALFAPSRLPLVFRPRAFAECRLDRPAEAGERSERKPGVERRRDGVHETAIPSSLSRALSRPGGEMALR
jgi:hypothetical protein